MEEIKKDENQEDVKNSKNNKKELEKIKALIETQKKEIEEKDDRLKRLMAEFENFKKEVEKNNKVLLKTVSKVGNILEKNLMYVFLSVDGENIYYINEDEVDSIKDIISNEEIKKI